MDFASDESYEEMINTLQKFLREAEEECSTMQSAGQDCVDNTENDPAATKANDSLQGCVEGIRTACETIQGIVSALQDELDRIHEATAKADSLG